MEDFCDVTLFSEDRKRFWAHKVVLASVSSFFWDKLQECQVINMKGVKPILLRAGRGLFQTSMGPGVFKCSWI